jgi:hypothetical protein
MLLNDFFATGPQPDIEFGTTADMVRESAWVFRELHKYMAGRGLLDGFLEYNRLGLKNHKVASHWYKWFRNHEDLCVLDQFQIRLLLPNRRTSARTCMCNVILHSFLPYMSAEILDEVADALDSKTKHPGEVLLEACSKRARELGFVGADWRNITSGLFDLGVVFANRTPLDFIEMLPFDQCIRHLSVFEGVAGENIQYHSKHMFVGRDNEHLRQNARELWEDHFKYCFEGRQRLDVAIKKIERVYGEMSAQLLNAVLMYPQYLGLSKKAMEDAMSHCGNDGLPLVLVFGRRWRNYFDRRLQSALDVTRQDDEDIEEFQDRINKSHAHRLVENLPKNAGFTSLKGLDDYLIKYDFARYRPWVHAVSRNWPHLNNAERHMPPKEAFDTMCARRFGPVLELIEHIPDALKVEIAKWVPNLLAEADEDELDHGRAFERLVTIAGTYAKSLDVPLPAWAQGMFTSGNLQGYFLPRSDARGMFIGYYTHCCQHVGTDLGAAECAMHAQTSPWGCNFVIVRHDEILANAWVFEGEDGRIVLDNIENVNTLDYNEDMKSIVFQLAESIDGRLVTIGRQYTKLRLEKLKEMAGDVPKGPEAPWWPKGYEGKYSDAESQALLADNRRGIILT